MAAARAVTEVVNGTIEAQRREDQATARCAELEEANEALQEQADAALERAEYVGPPPPPLRPNTLCNNAASQHHLSFTKSSSYRPVF